jgi:hypothetical protein
MTHSMIPEPVTGIAGKAAEEVGRGMWHWARERWINRARRVAGAIPDFWRVDLTSPTPNLTLWWHVINYTKHPLRVVSIDVPIFNSNNGGVGIVIQGIHKRHTIRIPRQWVSWCDAAMDLTAHQIAVFERMPVACEYEATMDADIEVEPRSLVGAPKRTELPLHGYKMRGYIKRSEDTYRNVNEQQIFYRQLVHYKRSVPGEHLPL